MDNSKNKRIAKNTLMLYIRMLLTMGISLYTSRVVLNVLGIDDYGINNVVGGVVILFSFLNGAMSAATQRFFSFEIAKNDVEKLTKTFSVTLLIHIGIAVIVVLLAETIGLWFLNNKMTLPADRMYAVHWVYQLSILGFVVTITQVPYNAAIIAYEKMNIFAYMSILEVILKLVVVFLLVYINFDKLILYAILTFSVSLFIRILYIIYVKRNFKSCYYKHVTEKEIFRPILVYASFNLVAHLAVIAKTQGVNVLLNVFFGPAINAANAIAMQIRSVTDSFVQNFVMAVNPQIVKSYASGNLEYMRSIIIQSSKFTFFLVSFFALPFLLEADYIINLWLDNPPKYTSFFSQLVIINLLVDRLSGTITYGALATGNVKKYQIYVSCLSILNIPFSYFLLKAGFPVDVVFYISIFISFLLLFISLFLVNQLIDLSIKTYLFKVVRLDILVFLLSFIIPYLITKYFEPSFFRLIWTTVSSILMILFFTFFVGLSISERCLITTKIKSILVKI